MPVSRMMLPRMNLSPSREFLCATSRASNSQAKSITPFTTTGHGVRVHPRTMLTLFQEHSYCILGRAGREVAITCVAANVI
ncbi:hypothetical protein ES702_00184 [subsurface metagenome]